MAIADWFYSRGGQQEGPTDLQTLRDMAAAGQLTDADLVWREGMPQWQPASQVREFGDLFAGTAAYDVAAAPLPAPGAAYAGPGAPGTGFPGAGQPYGSPYAQPLGYGGGHYATGRSYASEARTAMIVSIIGIFCFGIVLGPVGIVLGMTAKKNMRASGNLEGDGMATAAIVIGWIIVGLAVLGLLIAFGGVLLG